MPDRAPRVSGKEIVAALERAGWHRSGTRGSHVKLRSPSGSGITIIPIHGNATLPPGTLKNILRQTGLTNEELKELL